MRIWWLAYTRHKFFTFSPETNSLFSLLQETKFPEEFPRASEYELAKTALASYWVADDSPKMNVEGKCKVAEASCDRGAADVAGKCKVAETSFDMGVVGVKGKCKVAETRVDGGAVGVKGKCKVTETRVAASKAGTGAAAKARTSAAAKVGSSADVKAATDKGKKKGAETKSSEGEAAMDGVGHRSSYQPQVEQDKDEDSWKSEELKTP
ncbi:hypothetical protein SESBI_36568 [Sesbania bispinosa]|nr:hypothetical protein SESBI_36568 [Sesbania bispinosa]